MTIAERVQELWRFREVLKNFVAQDLKVKYRRSVLGFFWSLLNPLLQMLVLTAVFSLIFHIENFTLYLLSGLIPWGFLAGSIDACSMSIVGSESMLRRQYFPKLIFPLAVVTQNLITCILSLFVLLAVLGPFLGVRVTAAWGLLPLSFACLVSVALGAGAVLAVATVYFRDLRHLVSVVLGAWFYLTPILYPLEGPGGRAGPIPSEYALYFKLNPLYPIFEMFHRPLYHAALPAPTELAAAVAVAAVLLTAGLAVFWRCEDALIFAL